MKMILALLFMMLVGCQSVPVEQYADFRVRDEVVGLKPSRSIATSFVASMLVNPESAKFNVSDPVKCYMRNAPKVGGQITHYGWCTILNVAVQDSNGVYKPPRELRVFMSYRDGTYLYPSNAQFKEPWYKPQ